MLRSSQFKRFSIDISHHYTQVSDGKGGVIKFTPAEADKLLSVLTFTRRMRTLPLLPDKIAETPFTVMFKEDQFQITHSQHQETLTADMSEISDVIEAVQQGQQIAMDQRTILGSTKVPSRGARSREIVTKEPLD